MTSGTAKVKRRRRKMKEMAIAYKGGCCSRCGYSRCQRALEFHHVDPATKKFEISSGGYKVSWSRMVEELNKTVLVCANCHREIEEGV